MLSTIIFFIIDFIPNTAEEKNINKKIVIYQEENNNLEEKIKIIMKTYIDSEKNLYEDLNNKDIITLIETYPNLQDNKIIMEEINTYKENSRQIKILKIEKLKIEKNKWMYYFV